MLIAALFTIAKMQKHHKFLPLEKWVNEMWSNRTVEYDSAIKRMKHSYKL